jgi:hypothetical protein
VEQVEKSLHPITEELKRWQSIIGEHYINHKLEEQRNSLAINPKGIPLYSSSNQPLRKGVNIRTT